MGSVCCTSSRARDIAESAEEWSMERTGHTNIGAIRGTLSPPPISSRWDRRAHFSELAASYSGMLIHRTASSSSRSYRSNSISSESRTTVSHHRCETADGLLAVFNSPSDSFRYSHQLLDNITDSVTIPSEGVWKKSTARPSLEDSGLSNSSVPFAKTLKESFTNKHAQNYPKLDLSASTRNIELSLNCKAEGQMNEMTSTISHPYQQMLRTNAEESLGISGQNPGSFKSFVSTEPADLPCQKSSRWSKMDPSSNIPTDGEQDYLNEVYIRSTLPSHDPTLASHDPTTPQVESPKCELCTKRISQKSFWSFSKALGTKELPVVGILECGHVYHAECLDQATPTTQARDPPCPRCENQKRARTKMWEEDIGKSRIRERSFVKGKMSRVGVSLEDLKDIEPNRNFQAGHYECGLSETFAKKGLLQIAQNADRSLSTKSLLRKQFSLRGKVNKEASGSGFGSKRPGYAARVLPENTMREYRFCVGEKVSHV